MGLEWHSSLPDECVILILWPSKLYKMVIPPRSRLLWTVVRHDRRHRACAAGAPGKSSKTIRPEAVVFSRRPLISLCWRINR